MNNTYRNHMYIPQSHVHTAITCTGEANTSRYIRYRSVHGLFAQNTFQAYSLFCRNQASILYGIIQIIFIHIIYIVSKKQLHVQSYTPRIRFKQYTQHEKVISGVLVILSYLFQDKPILILVYTIFYVKAVHIL